jgi:hypothetical protein
MKRSLMGLLIVTLTIMLTAGTWAAQSRNKKRGNGGASSSSSGGETNEMELAADPRLQEIQRKFVIDAAKLAKDYERKHDIEGARGCYEQILRLVPHHPEAEKALDRIRGAELTAEKKKLQVRATDSWQDTGVNLIANRPLTIHAEGTWTFKIEQVLSADGMEIPKDLRDFNLGCLVGKIITSGDTGENKPFMVGKDVEFTPEKSGRLFLRMYDSDPSDNKGFLSVELNGTFEKGK